MASLESIPDSMLLDAAYLPAAPGLEPAIVLYSPIDLSPGAWRRAEDALEIPEVARRLTLALGDPQAPRFAPTRALAVPDALPYLIALSQPQVRPSLRAWQLAAHVARRLHEGVMLPRGSESTDRSLSQLAKAMPPASHAVLVELLESDDDLLGASAPGAQGTGYGRLTGEEALMSFLDTAQHAYSLGITGRTPAPRRGASRRLAKLRLRLSVPRGTAGAWLLHVEVPDDTSTERIASTLEDAAKAYRPLERVDPGACETPVELSIDEASALVAVAGDLRAMGATIELPERLVAGVSDHVSARMRFRSASGTPRSSAGPRFRLDDLVAYDLEVALGGQDVSAAQLRELASQARNLVRLGEEWVALDDATREQLEKLARTVEAHDANMANSQALAATLAGSAQLPGGITATVEAIDDGALERAVAYLRNPEQFPSIDDVPGFVGELRPYQQRGLDWLAGMASLPLGACLADDMGLGKTVQVIALLTHQRNLAAAEGERFRALVVCPTSLIGNWQRELTRFVPGVRVHVHHGPMRVTRPAELADADVVVTSYGLVARDRDMLSSLDWNTLVFDEAQSVKNPDTEQSRAVRGLRGRFRVALTGTPMENRLLELWAILDLLNPGLLGRAAAFNRRFASPIERTGDEQAAATLRAITRPFMLRRVKHDPEIVPDLPDKQEHAVHCTLTPEQAALYQATADQSLADVRQRDGIARRGAVLALLTRLKQICNHPAQALGESGPMDGRSGKLERLEAMLEEVIAEGESALVFTQYAQMGSLLASHLPEVLGCEVLYLHGGVPRPQREAMIARFQQEDAPPTVFVLSLKAGGLGLNLMSASHVFHYDRWWNPAVEDQATDRTHRIGQTRQIQVHKLVCAGTLEERISSIIEEKRALAGRIIEVSGTGEGWITELGDRELEELVALSAAEIEPVGS